MVSRRRLRSTGSVTDLVVGGVLVRRRGSVFDGLGRAVPNRSRRWSGSDEAVRRHHLDPSARHCRPSCRAGRSGRLCASVACSKETPTAGRWQSWRRWCCSATRFWTRCTARRTVAHGSLAQRLGGTALGWDALQPTGASARTRASRRSGTPAARYGERHAARSACDERDSSRWTGPRDHLAAAARPRCSPAHDLDASTTPRG